MFTETIEDKNRLLVLFGVHAVFVVTRDRFNVTSEASYVRRCLVSRYWSDGRKILVRRLDISL